MTSGCHYWHVSEIISPYIIKTKPIWISKLNYWFTTAQKHTTAYKMKRSTEMALVLMISILLLSKPWRHFGKRKVERKHHQILIFKVGNIIKSSTSMLPQSWRQSPTSIFREMVKIQNKSLWFMIWISNSQLLHTTNCKFLSNLDKYYIVLFKNGNY